MGNFLALIVFLTCLLALYRSEQQLRGVVNDSEQQLRAVENDDNYKVNITVLSEKGTGTVIVEVHRHWAPLGAQRFYDLVQSQYFDECKFFRVIQGFMAQIGIHKDPQVTAMWRKKVIQDDPVSHSNKKGTITFATSGKNSRTSQIFFNYGDNSFLDKQGFSPFGHVIEGMDHIDALYGGYGEGGKGDGTDGKGPSQAKINWQGNAYLDTVFPKLSYIVSAQIM